MPNSFIQIRNWYARFARPISSVSLVGGFVFNALTLTRVDMVLENFWVIAHLLVVAVCIVWINMLGNENQAEKNPSKVNFWLVNILQFFFGGLLSAFLVFYFRSSDLSNSWPFILMLVLAFWANESLRNSYARLSFQISFFYLSLFAFTIFFVPVVAHAIGSKIFLLSGAISLAAIGIFMLILDTTIVHEWQYADPETHTWSDCERIELAVVGGRDGGFRTYSMKTGMTPGRWRVTAATLKGAVIGRVRFNVVATDTGQQLLTKIND
jgi:hypothetical protein